MERDVYPKIASDLKSMLASSDEMTTVVTCAPSGLAWRRLSAMAEHVAPFASVVTILGEKGSGQEALARQLHMRGPLASSSFRRVDAREWLASAPNAASLRGFLYVDRVDLLSSAGQIQLLDLLETLRKHPEGRVIFVGAIQENLEDLAIRGQFNPELTIRLTALRLDIPPLRECREEIVVTAQSMLRRLCERYRQRPVTLTAGAISRLIHYTWPGNLDELASVMEASVFRAREGVLTAEDLQFATKPKVKQSQAIRPAAPDLLLSTMIRRHVRYVLDLNRGNKRSAAHQLGISRSTLYRFIGDAQEAR